MWLINSLLLPSHKKWIITLHLSSPVEEVIQIVVEEEAQDSIYSCSGLLFLMTADSSWVWLSISPNVPVQDPCLRSFCELRLTDDQHFTDIHTVTTLCLVCLGFIHADICRGNQSSWHLCSPTAYLRPVFHDDQKTTYMCLRHTKT